MQEACGGDGLVLLPTARASCSGFFVCGLLFNSARPESMLTLVSSKKLVGYPLTGSDEKSTRHGSGRANTVTRKEHTDDKSQGWGLGFHLSKESQGSTIEFGIRSMFGHLGYHESGSGRRQQMQGPVQ